MQKGFRVVAVSAFIAATTLLTRAEITPPSQAADIELQLGNLYFSEGRFSDSLEAFQRATNADDPVQARKARERNAERRGKLSCACLLIRRERMVPYIGRVADERAALRRYRELERGEVVVENHDVR